MSHKSHVILFICFALFVSCVASLYEIEKVRERGERIGQDIPINVQGFEITEPYHILHFVNQRGLMEAFGESGEESLCGLSKADFLAYVEWKIEDMDVLHVVLVERYFPGREFCLKEAWIFVRQDG
jgi:hypothetical protein